MSRITHIDGTPTQQRNAIRRTIAEILRRLMDKKTIDDETKDMLAFIVVGLRSMDQSIDQSATAWEKRDYYLKADQFRREWLWLPDTAKRLEEILRSDDWTTAPIELAGLSARFSDVKVTTYTKPLPYGKARIGNCSLRRTVNGRLSLARVSELSQGFSFTCHARFCTSIWMPSLFQSNCCSGPNCVASLWR
jgi:hypothetical protein